MFSFSRTHLTHLLVYLVARIISVIAILLPVNAVLGAARGMGWLLWRFDRTHRNRCLENLRAAYPEKPETELQRLGLRSMQHLCHLPIDLLFSPRLIHTQNATEYLHFKNLGQPIRIILQNRGAIMLTGHYGNFEILGYGLAVLGFETYSVARPIDNPYIDNWVLSVRERRGQVILSKRGASATAEEVLERKGVLGFIADQNAGPKGMFVPFFGRLASTYKSIGLLAIRHNVPVIVGCARRVHDRFEFDIVVSDVIYPEEWHGKPDELRYITERYTKAIETFVREEPEQYWWVHRRWKTRPKEEIAAAASATAAPQTV